MFPVGLGPWWWNYVLVRMPSLPVCPADNSLSPVLTFVLQTEPACHPVFSVWGERHASSLRACEAITEGRVVFVKLGTWSQLDTS